MTICARFDGRQVVDCTRGYACHCANESGFRMIYGERVGEVKIEEKGIFYSVAEFAPYRALGWHSTAAVNHAADAYLFALGKQELAND